MPPVKRSILWCGLAVFVFGLAGCDGVQEGMPANPQPPGPPPDLQKQMESHRDQLKGKAKAPRAR